MTGAAAPSAGGGDERGFALAVVIAVLAILATLAAGFAVATRQQTNLARNTIAMAQARALADAGVSLAMAGLVSRDPATRWSADGRPRTLAFAGAEIRVRAQDEAGKIDLNWAPEALIAGLLDELAVEPEARAGIVAGIVARRRAARLPPAPPGELMGAALLGGPRLRDLADAPFRSTGELLTLPGMTRAIYERVRPFVTVYAQSAHVNRATAPREVLLAVPGISEGDVERILAAREPRPAGAPGVAPADPPGAGGFLGALDTRALTVVAEAVAGPGTRFVRDAVIATTSDPYHPFRILEWRWESAASAPPPR